MTIIFRNDWLRFPTAVPDYKTSNESFLRIVEVYDKMGVKNSLFPLAIYQPSLIGVDPYSPDLTTEQKIRIGLECQYNYWYYLREIARIPATAGFNALKYRANRGNMYLSWCIQANMDFSIIMPRQTGKSVGADSATTHALHFGQQNAVLSLITKDAKLRVRNIERLKKMRNLLPPYLISLQSQDKDNQEELTYLHKHNFLITGIGQNSETAANNMGRGFTTPWLQIDEPPFISFIEATIKAALPGGLASKREAEQNGLPFTTFFTTTAGKKDSRDGRYMYDLITGGFPWTEALMDCENRAELVDVVTKGTRGVKILINGTFSHLQLGYDDKWMEEAIRETGLTGEEADRDLFNRWTSGSLSSPLAVQLLELINSSRQDPMYSEITPERYTVRWFIPRHEIDHFMQNNFTIMSADPSEAVGRDDIGIVLSDVRNMRTIAAITVNESNIWKFISWLGQFLIRYPKILFNLELKSQGQSIVDGLIDILTAAGIDPYKRIFNRVIDEATDSQANRERYKSVMHYGRGTRSAELTNAHRRTFGFVTTGTSRKVLYGPVLQNAAKLGGSVVKDPLLVDQILGLVKKDDRIDHAASGHDDMVIAWLLNLWTLTYTRNLDEYGLNPADVLSAVNGSVEMECKTSMDQLKLSKEKERKETIEQLLAKLEECTEEVIAIQIEAKLRQLVAIGGSDTEFKSISDIINSAKEKRVTANNAMRRRKGLAAQGFRR